MADLERMIEESNRRIKRYEKQIVSDTVKGSREDLTIGQIKITGIAQQKLDEQNELNRKRLKKMKVFRERLEKKTVEVEEYIQTIPDSEVRRIARLRYINNLSWKQVAVHMGSGYTEDFCRQKMNNFIKK